MIAPGSIVFKESGAASLKGYYGLVNAEVSLQYIRQLNEEFSCSLPLVKSWSYTVSSIGHSGETLCTKLFSPEAHLVDITAKYQRHYAAMKIQSAWRRAICDPIYTVCRSRLDKEFAGL